MAIKIKKTSDQKIDSVGVVICGGPGVGKTRLMATAPRPIIISAESGLLSLAGVDCDYIEVHNLKEFDQAYREVKSSLDYDTICLDSISEIGEVLLAELKPQFKDARQAYMALSDAMMPMLRRFRDIKGKHTIFTSKMIVRQDEDSGKVTEELLIPGRVLPAQIPYMVDEFFHLVVDRKGICFLQTKPDRTRFAKDRSGALDDQEPPNMTNIFNKIMAKSGKS